VSNFDILGNTVQTLARSVGKLPKNWCQRQLDDNPVVAPAKTGWCESYSREYESVCEKINIKLAAECPKKDKAFKNEKKGKVLGIWFDTSKMEWSLPSEKAEKARRAIFEVYNSETISLHTLQSLVGRLNDIALMCPFLSAFRRNISALLANATEVSEITVPNSAKDDLLVWWAAIDDCENGLPIPSEPSSPNIYHKTFAIHTNTTHSDDENSYNATGLGCFGSDEDSRFLFSCSYIWNKYGLKAKCASDASRPVNFMGMILCLMANKDSLKNQHIVFVTENITNSWDWVKQYAKDDDISNILIRCIAILAAFLGSRIHVEYKYKMKSWEGISAIDLSRENRRVSCESESLKDLKKYEYDDFIIDWLKKPCANESLPKMLANSLV
jgi:hypothetical protein